jgi:hypothetical protein
MMVIIFILGTLACLLFLFRKRGYSFTKTKSLHSVPPQFVNPSGYSEAMLSTDEHLNRIVIKKRMIPRKTYLSGFLRGKYWGEAAIIDGAPYEHETFYDFHIYEADVYIEPSYTCSCITPCKLECNGLHTEVEGRFRNKADSVFPRERLPQLLPIVAKKEGKEYAINIHEPQLTNARFISRLHQTEGEEVFGTIEANITGFILDFTIEAYSETQHSEDGFVKRTAPFLNAIPNFHRDNTSFTSPYGAVRTRYNNKVPNDGCVSSVLGVLAIVVWATFLIAMLPQAAIILPFIAVPLLARLIPSVIWKWVITVVGAIMCVAVFASIISLLRYQPAQYPKPVVKDNSATDTMNQTQINDTIITHHLQWTNYDGQDYQGDISLRRSALRSATQFKTSLQVPDNTKQSYDEVVYRLKEHDKDNLAGVYQLFDSIRSTQHLQADKFAELIVSFVQDIPYTVVLPKACDASLYSDQFIRNYLATPDARCDGHEKFGINTPVEFMASLDGDCDTRTLLLYTIFSHYKYDVALLSSEFYNHSLIGVNLPYNGAALEYNSKRYILWETTAAGIRPGVLPNEISNPNYWRISLKSE